MIDFNKVTFLLGSGISIPSGMPSVEAITQAVLTPFEYRLDGALFPDATVSSFLHLIKSLCDQHLAIKGLSPANYEDIYYLCKQLVDFERGEYDNPALLPFLADVKAKSVELQKKVAHNLNTGLASRDLGKNLTSLADKSLIRIESIVSKALATPEKIKGLGLLKKILDSSLGNKLHLITLNHDLLTETFLSHFGISDGFEPFSEQLAKFRPNYFSAENSKRVSILKPHGSIDWYRYKDKSGSEICCKLLSGEAAYAQNEKGESIDANPKRLLLAGTTNKEISYGSGIFLEILHQLHSRLKRTKTLVSSGYGFRDKGINNRIWAWLESNDSNRLIILHDEKFQDELFRNAKGSLKNNFDRLKESNRIQFIDKWICNIDLEELTTVIR